MENPQIAFSIIIPAFNEKDRLPAFLGSLSEEIQKSNLSAEVIVVDDGSSPEHKKAYSELVNSIELKNIKILRHEKNMGKGAALKTGLLSARGEWIGYADADGSTPAKEVMRVLKIALASQELDGVFGSRVRMLGYDVDRQFKRHFFGRFFATLTYMLLGIPFYDPQCGCKFFRRSKILSYLELCQEKEYLFDIELIALGYLNKLKFLEVPISWKDVAGSKVSVIKDSLKMAADVFSIRRRLVKIGIL